VILIDEGEGAVGLDAIGEIGIAAGDQDEVALECAVFVDLTRAVDAGVKAVIGTQLREERAFGEDFGGRSGHKQFVSIERIEDFAGVKRAELNAKIRVGEFGATDDLLYALSQSGFRLRTGRHGLETEKE